MEAEQKSTSEMSMNNENTVIEVTDENEIQNSEPTEVQLQAHEKDKNEYYLLKYTYDSIKDQTSPPNCGEIVDDGVFVQKSPMGNTVLHIAALYGNDNWVEKVFRRALFLLRAKNANGDTALHVAARAGQISILKKLLASLLHNLPHPYSENPKETLYEILAKNEQGNNFFHEALLNGHKYVMNILGSQELQMGAGFRELVERAALFWTNREEKSVLHLAIEKGYKDIVDHALNKLIRPHSALEELIENHQELAEMIEAKPPLFEQDQGKIKECFNPFNGVTGSATTDIEIMLYSRKWWSRNGKHRELSQDSPIDKLIENHQEPTQLIPYGPYYVPPQKSPVIRAIVKQNQGTKMESMELCSNACNSVATDMESMDCRSSGNRKHQELSQDSPIDKLTKNHQEPTQLIPYVPYYVPPGKSPLIAAILKQDQDILRTILVRKRDWINLKDNEGRSALHYAASIGYIDGAEDLLKCCKHCHMERDKDGFFPLHLASAGGHDEVVKKLLEHEFCPDPREILDNYGRNIVHIAAEMGKYNVVRYILQDANHGLADMINDKDANGNTPLHLATLHFHPKIVHALTWDKRVDLSSVNRKNQTALDTFMHFLQENPSYRQQLTWIALKSAGVKHTKRGSHSIEVPPPPQNAETVSKQKTPNMDPFKDRINTLILVSTIITTVTFAAGFTLPGGTNSNSSDPGQGMALMLNRVWFKLFMFCITISMYGSISVTIVLIWAQLGDLTLALFALEVAKPLLVITLATLSVAFMAGVQLVISNLSWLATAILVLCVIFILMLLLLYTILWLPSSSSKPVIRYISYYPFQFLTWLVEEDETEVGINEPEEEEGGGGDESEEKKKRLIE